MEGEERKRYALAVEWNMWIGQVGPSTLEKWRIKGMRLGRGRSSMMAATRVRGGGRRIVMPEARRLIEFEEENAMSRSSSLKGDVVDKVVDRSW